jgi:hypothetical protein
MRRSSAEMRLERFPITWTHVIGKESLKIKMLEQAPIEKSVSFFGTC